MKCILILAGCLVIVAIAQAYPQRDYPQHLEYHPSPTQRPARPIRFRRDVKIGNTITTNPNGGQDVSLSATKVVGNEHGAAFGSVFAQGNTKGGETIRGATIGAGGHGVSASVTRAQTSITDSFIKQAEANLKLDNSNTISAQASQMDTKIKGINFRPDQRTVRLVWRNGNGFGASASRDTNKGVSSTLTKSASANLFNNARHSVDGNVFNSNVAYDNGYSFDKTGGSLGYSHVDGHGLNAGLTRFSGIGKQASLDGYSNLWSSNDGSTRLNANAGASRWLNGPFSGQTDYGFGLGLSYNDWRG